MGAAGFRRRVEGFGAVGYHLCLLFVMAKRNPYAKYPPLCVGWGWGSFRLAVSQRLGQPGQRVLHRPGRAGGERDHDLLAIHVGKGAWKMGFPLKASSP